VERTADQVNIPVITPPRQGGVAAAELEDFTRFLHRESNRFRCFILRLPRADFQEFVHFMLSIVDRNALPSDEEKQIIFDSFAGILHYSFYGNNPALGFNFKPTDGATNMMARNYVVGSKTPWHTDVANPDFSFNVWLPLVDERYNGLISDEGNGLFLHGNSFAQGFSNDDATQVMAAPIVLAANEEFYELLIFDAKHCAHGAPTLQAPRKSIDFRMQGLPARPLLQRRSSTNGGAVNLRYGNYKPRRAAMQGAGLGANAMGAAARGVAGLDASEMGSKENSSDQSGDDTWMRSL
jgi:hypothetical protein